MKDVYSFTKMIEADLPLLFKWANEPHVNNWWDSEDVWDDFKFRYLANINSKDSFPFIVRLDDKPIGYINYWTTESDPDFRDLFPKGSVGTDQFIGEPALIGKGHGAGLVKQFSDWLLSKPEIPVVMVDPDALNLSAIRCYQKAGFRIVQNMKSAEGTITLMEKRINV